MKDQKQFDRLKSKTVVHEPTGCWHWTGFVHTERKYAAHRYGGTSLPAPDRKRGSRTLHAHRAMWIVVHGEPAKGMEVCHECDNPLCINPEHLFLGTHQQNMADSKKKGRHFLSAKKVCKRGHALEGDNVYFDVKSGTRHCKACQAARQAAAYRANPKRHNERQKMYRQQKRARLAASSAVTVLAEPR